MNMILLCNTTTPIFAKLTDSKFRNWNHQAAIIVAMVLGVAIQVFKSMANLFSGDPRREDDILVW